MRCWWSSRLASSIPMSTGAETMFSDVMNSVTGMVVVLRVDEAEVTVGEDADQAVVRLCDGHAADVVRGHDVLGVAEGCRRWERDRIDDHAGL